MFLTKYLIGETQWCFLKQNLTSRWRNNIYILFNNIRTGQLHSLIWSNSFINIRPNNIQQNLDTIYWDKCGKSNITNIMTMYTQFTYINCVTYKVEGWWKNVLCWFLKTDLQTGTLVTFTLCIVTSEITETVDAITKTGLLILAEMRGELITQMAVRGTGKETMDM